MLLLLGATSLSTQIRSPKGLPKHLLHPPNPIQLHYPSIGFHTLPKMDIIPFYYENGQLEALSSAHQWLKQSEMAGTTFSIWSNGLNEAIARERFARNATLAAANGAILRNSEPSNLASEAATVPMAMPSGTQFTNQFLQPQHQQRQRQQHQQRQHPMEQSVKSVLISKINRRRKAAIIARCAGSIGGTSAADHLLPETSIANANAVTFPSPISGMLSSSTTTSSRSAKAAYQRRTTPTTKATLRVESPSTNGRGGGGTTDGSESEEDSDVEVFELDATDFGSNELFDRLNKVEERKTNDDDPKVAQWRDLFEKAITERYRNKCRRRNMLCRRMLEFNLQRLKATENIELNQLLLTDLRIREKYAVSTDPITAQILLTHRNTGRVFICLEDMFDVLSQFHIGHGHGGSRKAMYVEARKRFANVSKEIVREFLKGCDLCTMRRDNTGGWGGRRVKGTGRGGAAARTNAARTTEIVGGLALRQYMEQVEKQQQNEGHNDQN